MGNHFNCIYMYTNKINGKRYVGQAVNFNVRHKKHIASSYNEKAKYDYNVPFHNAIRKYGIENFKIKILAENIPTQEKMNEYEVFFIKRYDTLCKNGKGYNIASGGSNGNKLAGKTEEEMKEFGQKISKAKKGENNPMYGKHHSDETKQKLSDSWTKERKKEQSKVMKGENHPKAKRVAQYDLDGNLIKIWDYAKQITDELGINHGSIISCCKFWKMNCNKEKWFKTHKNRPSRTAGGYIWRYAEETE